MLGKMIAYDGTVEELDRFTLHIHLLTWLMDFNHMRDNMPSEDLHIRDKAQRYIVQYITNIMTASYPDLDFTHTTTNEGNEICTEKILPLRNQKIKNLHNKKKYMDDYGIVVKYNFCHQSFTTVKMVNNSLKILKEKMASETIIHFSIHSQEQEVICAQCFPVS